MNQLFCILCFFTFLTFSCGGNQSIEETPATTEVTQSSADGKTILAVFAHPDDEASVAPILAKYAREGAIIHLVAVTDGRYGVTEHAGIPAGDSLAAVRDDEFICAGESLGATSVKILGYHDQLKMQEGFQTYWQGFNNIRSEIEDMFVVLQPDVVLTWSHSGWTGHPDHRLVSSIVTEVFESRDWGEKPKSLFYPGLPAQNVPDGLEMPVAVMDMKFLNTQITCSEQDLAIAKQAWLCHKSQYRTDQIEELWALLSQVNGATVFLKENTKTTSARNSIF